MTQSTENESSEALEAAAEAPENTNAEEAAADGGGQAGVEAEDAGDKDVGEEVVEESLEDALAAAQKKADENWDLYLRSRAEADNARKRAQGEVDKARKFALEKIAGDLLTVIDTFEMGLQAASGEGASLESLREGTELTMKQLVSALERHGVVAVDPAGERFDPQQHEAMTMQPSDEAEPNTVLTVVQKGYLLNERLLRPARVIVATKPAE